MNDLMSKLAVAKKIMDKHENTPRGTIDPTLMESSEGTYNIPQEMIGQPTQPPIQMGVKNTQPITKEAIQKSRLPEEIKKLMMENPIQQPQMSGPVLSDEIIEGATRLMGNKTPVIRENIKGESSISQNTYNNSELKQMIRDVVRDTVRDVVKEELQNAGMLTESTQNANDVLSLRVGKHIFEGKVLRVKKVK